MNIGLTIEHCTASHRNCFGQNRSFTSLSLRTPNPFFCWIHRLTMRSEAVSCFFICLCLLTLLPKRNEFPQIVLTIVASNEKVSSHFSHNCCQKQQSTSPMLRQMFCQPYVVPMLYQSYVLPNHMLHPIFHPILYPSYVVPILCCTQLFRPI